MNKLSLLFVTLVVGTFMTFGETMWGQRDPSKSSKVVDLCAVDPSSVPLIDRISQDGNVALLLTGLNDLMEALEQNHFTVTKETKENKGKVLTRLGGLLESDALDDWIKLKVAKILNLSCVSDCDHLIKFNLSELLIRKLNENLDSVTKAEILSVLNSAAQKSANARDTLVDQGIIKSVTTLVSKHKERPKSQYERRYESQCERQYVLRAAALLIRSILSIKDLNSEKTHSLVPVLSELLEHNNFGQRPDESTLMGTPRTRSPTRIRRDRLNYQSLERIGFALDAVMNLLTVQTCMEGFDDRDKRCKLIARLAGLLDDVSYQFRSLQSLEKLYGFTQDGPQETELEPRLTRIRLTRIREATRGDIICYEQGASSPSNTSQVN